MTSAHAGIVLEHIGRLTGKRCALQPPDAELLERFTAQRDEAAFTTLVERHGPMVLNVCRSILRHEHDAEDAFQAAFLVLARKANVIRQPEALAGWLYEVAHHAALRAQAETARRREQERRAAPLAAPGPALDMTLRDLQLVLHEELRRLPEKYRLPLVLCYLEDRSHEEAAAQLGWSRGTFRGRLERGRERLRRRLVSRGVALSGLLCATAVIPRASAASLLGPVLGIGQSAARASLPASLAHAAVRCGLSVAIGTSAAGDVAPPVAALAKGVTGTLSLTKTKLATIVLVALSLVAGAGAWMHQGLAAKAASGPLPELAQAGKPEPVPYPSKGPRPPRESATPEEGAVTYAGRVVGPDGSPIAGAKVYYHFITSETLPIPARATTDAEGRFSFTLGPKDVPLSADATRDPPLRAGQVVAKADGFTYGWSLAPKQPGDLVLRLARDTTPIEGRMVDLQGKPLAGLRVTVWSIAAPESGDLSGYVKAMQSGERHYEAIFKHLRNWLTNPIRGGNMASFFPSATTDAEGKFRLQGIGPERLVELRVEGQVIETQMIFVLTRTRPSGSGRIKLHARPHEDLDYYHADAPVLLFWNGFEHAAPPGQVIVGKVRDERTGRPIAGATVESYQLAGTNLAQNTIYSTTTGPDGNYQLSGLPRGKGNRVRIRPPKDQPYLPVVKGVPVAETFFPATLDVKLAPGVWVDVTTRDKRTGKPVPGMVSYFVLPENWHGRSFARSSYEDSYNNFMTIRNDGTFRFVAVPKKAILAFRANWDKYPIAREAGTIRLPSGLSPSNFAAFAEVSPKLGDAPITVAFRLDAGEIVKGTVLGEDGKPLTRALATGLRHDWFTGTPDALPSGEFTVLGLSPARPRLLCFAHTDKKLAGSVVVRGDEKGPVTVKLRPWATVSGRLIDAEGKPIRNAALAFIEVPPARPDRPRSLDTGLHVIERWGGKPSRDPRTDEEGRFHADSLVPGLKYNLALYDPSMAANFTDIKWTGLVFRNLVLEPGQNKDLGDVRLQPFPKE
jgi:RNA polymerase sigma factor (sigma-70 family)